MAAFNPNAGRLFNQVLITVITRMISTFQNLKTKIINNVRHFSKKSNPQVNGSHQTRTQGPLA